MTTKETTPGPETRGPGRPPLQLDEPRILHLASNMATMAEIAADQRCSVDTLENNFSDLIKRGKELAKLSLRARQFQLAMGSPPTPDEYLRERVDAEGRQTGDLVKDREGNYIRIRKATDGVKPHVTMLIWLGKQYLGQSDKMRWSDDADGFEFVP